MTADSPPLPWPPDATFWQRAWTFIKVSPLTSMAIFTILSLLIKENFPFSNYPMYSNPSPERNYSMVTGMDNKPLPIAELTGITCPKVGKIFRTIAAEHKSKAKKEARSEDDVDNDSDQLTREQTQAIGMEIFKQLRREATKLKKTLPPQLRLTRIYISYKDGKIVDRPLVLAEEPAPVTPVP